MRQATYKPRANQIGFSLVEVMISVALGLIMSTAIVQIMISNAMTEKLNSALANTQESGRYIITKLREELLMTGLYDNLNPHLNNDVDIHDEAIFLRNHPVPIVGDFVNRTQLGSLQGNKGANDTLVVSFQGKKDCRGFTLGYKAGEEFFVVNEYFVSKGKLKCRGFDGRVLRGQKIAQGHNSHAAYTLLDNVLSFQVSYGIALPATNKAVTSSIQYIDASKLAPAFKLDQRVVSLRLAIVIKGEGDIRLDQKRRFKLLNEDALTAPDNGLYTVFETTVALRNMKNLVRSSA